MVVKPVFHVQNIFMGKGTHPTYDDYALHIFFWEKEKLLQQKWDSLENY